MEYNNINNNFHAKKGEIRLSNINKGLTLLLRNRY